MSNSNDCYFYNEIHKINTKLSEINSRLDTIANELLLLKKSENQFQTTRPMAPHYKAYKPDNIVKK